MSDSSNDIKMKRIFWMSMAISAMISIGIYIGKTSLVSSDNELKDQLKSITALLIDKNKSIDLLSKERRENESNIKLNEWEVDLDLEYRFENNKETSFLIFFKFLHNVPIDTRFYVSIEEETKLNNYNSLGEGRPHIVIENRANINNVYPLHHGAKLKKGLYRLVLNINGTQNYYKSFEVFD